MCLTKWLYSSLRGDWSFATSSLKRKLEVKGTLLRQTQSSSQNWTVMSFISKLKYQLQESENQPQPWKCHLAIYKSVKSLRGHRKSRESLLGFRDEISVSNWSQAVVLQFHGLVQQGALIFFRECFCFLWGLCVISVWAGRGREWRGVRCPD